MTGGVPLRGTVSVGGSKNAALPIMAAALLADGPVKLCGVPRVADVDTLALLLGHLGVETKRDRDGHVHLATVDPRPIKADYELVRRMRASFCVLGPLVARRGRAVVSLPGGCNIGTRPVDLHLRGLEGLGATVRIEHGYVVAEARRLVGTTIDLSGPCGPSVTGTANVMAAAALAHGRTVITSAAREPEVADLGQFLNGLGAKISGLGTATIEIEGVERLGGGEHHVIRDRIEAGTLLIAAAITRGEATVDGADETQLRCVLDALTEGGVEISLVPGGVAAGVSRRGRPLHITARPYPGIPTDLQAQFMALTCVADGRSTIRDAVFPDRLMHVAELNRLGARIRRRGATAEVDGVSRLSGATIMASDLRASAALVLAGLAAKGETVVRRVYHLDRGYERLEHKLAHLGARIVREPDDERLPVAEPPDSALVAPDYAPPR